MRKGLGHSEPFGKRKPQKGKLGWRPRLDSTAARRAMSGIALHVRDWKKPSFRNAVGAPTNMGHEAKLRAEQAGPVRTQRGRRPTVRPKPHAGPYTPEHKDHRGRPVVPGSRARRPER